MQKFLSCFFFTVGRVSCPPCDNILTRPGEKIKRNPSYVMKTLALYMNSQCKMHNMTFM